MNVIDRIEVVEKQLDALISRAEIWQLLFDECPIAIACFDQNMNFYLVNNEFCSLTEYDKEQIIGEKLKIVLPQKFRKKHLNYESEFKKNPERKVNRHGLSPEILTRSGKLILVDIDLSFIDYQNTIYYTAFIRRI